MALAMGLALLTGATSVAWILEAAALVTIAALLRGETLPKSL